MLYFPIPYYSGNYYMDIYTYVRVAFFTFSKGTEFKFLILGKANSLRIKGSVTTHLTILFKRKEHIAGR